MRDRGPGSSGHEREPAEDAVGGSNSLENLRLKAAMRRRIQRKAEAKARANAADLAIPEGGGSELPGGVREKMESKIGGDFSGVRVHTGSESRQAAKDLGAKAFTVGNDIHFSEGRFNPGSRDGQHLLAHELAHVAQGQGGLHEDLEDDGVSQEGDPAEKRADAVADSVVGGKEAKPKTAKKDEEAEAEKLRVKKGEPFKIGTELWVQRSMFFGAFKYHHAGVYCGKGQVVHVNSTAVKATKNLVEGRELASVEQTTLENFQGDGNAKQGPSPQHFTPRERQQRAVSRLGEQWHYRPLDHNCQHFTSEVVSGGPNSPEGQEIAHKFGMETHQDKQEEEKEDKQKKYDDANFNQEVKQNPRGKDG
jgi:hypothetical protein